MTTAEIVDFFIGKGFLVKFCRDRKRGQGIVIDLSGPCSFGSSGLTADEALQNAYRYGTESFGSFSRPEIDAHYSAAFERATGKSHKEVFGA